MAAGSSSEIIECSNSGNIFGTSNIGGIGGYCSGIIKNCLNSGNITSDVVGSSGGSNVGGVVGYINEGGYLIGCSNGGTITCEAEFPTVGGIAGGGREINISGCSNSGSFDTPNCSEEDAKNGIHDIMDGVNPEEMEETSGETLDPNGNTGSGTTGTKIVIPESQYRTKEDIQYAVQACGWPKTWQSNIDDMMPGLLQLQDDYGYDPLVAISLFRGESSVGTSYEKYGQYRLDNHKNWDGNKATSFSYTHKYSCYENYSDAAHDWGNYAYNRFSEPITTWEGLESTDGYLVYQNCNVDDGNHAISYYNDLNNALNNRK